MENNSQIETKKQEFSKEFNDLLLKYGYKVQISLDFPEYKVLPDDLKLALVVMNKHKNQFLLNFIETEGQK